MKFHSTLSISSLESIPQCAIFLQQSGVNKNPHTMFDLFQQRRIFMNSKRKPLTKNLLPQIKYTHTLPKKMNDDLLLNNNSRLLYSYQPLSNILISKKITPPNPQQITLLVSKKKTLQNANVHNFKIRKESAKKTVDQEGEDDQGDRRNSTSLSQRIPKNQSQEQHQQETKARFIKPEQLTFAVVQGNNNQQLVRQLLLERKIWKEIKWGQGVPNFKWVFYKDRHNYKKMWSYTKKKIINHFQFNQEISTKDSLVKNLQIYCQTKKIEVFTITPITFIVDFDDEYCEYNIKQFLQFFSKNDPRKNNQKKANNFPFGFLSKFEPYMSWQNPQIKKKVNILSKPINNATYYSQNSYLWLLKPTGLNRGRGIEIFDSIEQLEKILLDYLLLMNRKKLREKGEKQKGEKQKGEKTQKVEKGQKDKHEKEKEKQPERAASKQLNRQQDVNNEVSTQCQQSKGSSPQKFKLNTCSFVIQKYVEKPFLINNRKFDIRVWTLITDSMNIYFFKQGYIRTSAQQFSTEDIENYFIHLTNNAIQKYSQNYGQFQNANQLSFSSLKNFMPQEDVQRIWNRIKEVTFMAFSSVKKKINANQRKHCFEVFGLDFFIDSELKVWLIEVNENPCIQCSSPLLGQLIPRMLNDAFKLTIDQIIERKIEEKPYPVKGYTNTQNMWEILGQLIPNSQYSPKK